MDSDLTIGKGKQFGNSRQGRKSYNDENNESRVRKPMDSEHEQKILKLKNEKTKRELHVQDLEYKVHILE